MTTRREEEELHVFFMESDATWIKFRASLTLRCSFTPAVSTKRAERSCASVKVPKDAPPMFFVHALDDNVSGLKYAAVAAELKKMGGCVEAHVYATGGHGYGLRYVEGPTSDRLTEAV